jgi:cytochrome o ubiquinol oxidase operon protein cyoD
MNEKLAPEAAHGSYKSYTLGFLLSVVLTLVAYFPVARHVHSHHLIYSDKMLIFGVMGLAVVQLAIQLLFFLHLGKESKPRWNLTVFLFMLMVVVIIVGGSLWIMYHLNYNLTPQSADKQLIQEEGIHK